MGGDSDPGTQYATQLEATFDVSAELTLGST